MSNAISISRTNFNAFLLFSGALLCYSLPAYFFSPQPVNILFLAICLVLILANASKLKLTLPFVLVIISIPFFALVVSIYWNNPRLSLLPIYLVTSLLVMACVNKKSIDLFVDIASAVILMVLLGAVLGFFAALFGMPPFLEFENPDGRTAYLYLGTVSNSVILNFIRPSGIYDEPGTLSFVTCVVVAMRHYIGKNQQLSFVIIALGIVTFSAAHVIFFVVYLLTTRNVSFAGILFTTLVVFLSLWIIPDLFAAFESRLFSRFQFIDGNFQGNSRAEITQNALSYLNFNVFFWGLNPSCFIEGGQCSKDYLELGENPFTLLVVYGIFLSWPYYAILLAFLVRSFQKNGGLAFGLFALLLQRPNLLGFGYSLLILLVLFMAFGFKQLKSGSSRNTS